MNYHFILDFETVGQDVFTAPFVSCSYYIFDWDRFTSANPYTFEELIEEIVLAKFNLQEQHEAGYRLKKSNIQWWLDNGLQKYLEATPDDISVEEFVQRLYDYLLPCKIHRWWSRSNTFDPILIHRAFRDHSDRESLDRILPYWKVRDIRTYIDTQFNFQNKVNGFCPIDDEDHWNKVFIQHDPVHDVAADILRMQRIQRTISL